MESVLESGTGNIGSSSVGWTIICCMTGLRGMLIDWVDSVGPFIGVGLFTEVETSAEYEVFAGGSVWEILTTSTGFILRTYNM